MAKKKRKGVYDYYALHRCLVTHRINVVNVLYEYVDEHRGERHCESNNRSKGKGKKKMCVLFSFFASFGLSYYYIIIIGSGTAVVVFTFIHGLPYLPLLCLNTHAYTQ